MTKTKSTYLAIILSVVGNSPAMAATIEWESFASWTVNSLTGSIAYQGGFINVTITPPSGSTFMTTEVSGQIFDNNTALYENLTTATHSDLGVIPDPMTTGSPYFIEFDFVGASLGVGEAFTIGQLFVSSGPGPLSDVQISAFGIDDSTAFDLTNLAFEQVGAGVGFQNPLIWDPSTGSLIATSPVSASANSTYGFFSPTSGEIGRLLYQVNTLNFVNGDQVEFGFLTPVPTTVPEPGTLALLGIGLFGMGLARRRRKV